MTKKEISKQEYIRRRSRARRLVMQCLYQWQLNPVDYRDLISQHKGSREYEDADARYFKTLLRQAIDNHSELSEVIAKHADRPVDQIDPLEMAVLLVALVELQYQFEVPAKVAINEAIELCRRFGATDSHKYVNAILDRAAKMRESS